MLVVIPARGGSKGVPGKNIKNLEGKPLIQYTIEAAKKIFKNEEIIVSTDDVQIKKEVEKIGLKVPFLRPDYLATDNASTQDVLIHALDYFGDKEFNETVVLLQPTSPFRTSKHIKEALELYDNSIDMVVSVKETDANPYYVLREENSQGYLELSKKGNFTRRQDCPKVYELNGAIYIINSTSLKRKQISKFKKVRKYEMDKMSSLDIDTPFDWMLAEMVLKHRLNSKSFTL